MMASVRRASEARVLDAAAKEQVRRALSYEDDYDEDMEAAGVAELDAEDEAVYGDELDAEDEDPEDAFDAAETVRVDAPKKRSSLARLRKSLGKSVEIVTGGKRSSLRASLRRSLRKPLSKPQWTSLGSSPLAAIPNVRGSVLSWKTRDARATPWADIAAAETNTLVSLSSCAALVACATQGGDAFVGLEATVPIQVDESIVQVACGAGHIVLLGADGRVFAVAAGETTARPVAVPLDEPVVQVISTADVVVALGVSGRVFASRRKAPFTLFLFGKALKYVPVRGLAAGVDHWVAVSVSGRVYGCGSNADGQLGLDPSVKSVSEPTRLPAPFAVDIASCGDAHTVLVGRPGALVWLGQGRPTSADAMAFFQDNMIEISQAVGGGADGATSFLATSGEIFSWAPGDGAPHAVSLSDSGLAPYELVPLGDRVIALAAPNAAASIAREVRMDLGGRSHEPAWISSAELYNVATEALESRDLSETLFMMRRLLQDPYMLSGSLSRPAYAPTAKASRLAWGLSPAKAALRADKALGSGVDIEGAVRALLAATKAIVELESNEKTGFEPACKLMQSLLRPVTRALVKFASFAEEPDQVRAYFLLFVSPTSLLAQFEHERLVIATEKLPRQSVEKLLHKWLFLEVPGDILAKFVTPRLVDAISVYLGRRKIADPSLKQLCFVTKRVYLMNAVRHEEDSKRRFLLSTAGRDVPEPTSSKAIVDAPSLMQAPIPMESFYTRSLLAFPPELLAGYFRRWRDRKVQGKGKAAWAIFEYGFLLSPDTKTLLLMIEDREQMQATVFQGQLGGLAMFTGRIDHFVLEVSRDDLLNDTMRALQRAQATDLKKPLMVKFKGEEGVDAGGVKKEFFQLLAEKLFSEDFGMFAVEGDTGELWFNIGPLSTAVSDPEAYLVVGKLLGLAIYNATIIDMNFALAFYRTLLGKVRAKPGLRDLAELNPVLADGLRQMLEYDGDDFEDVFMATFEAPAHRCMSGEPEPLIPGGENIDVTRENVKGYVDAYVRFIMIDSIKLAAEPLMRGFQILIPNKLTSFSLFRPDELELALTGSDDFDVDQIRDNTVYEGYGTSSPVVQWLWEIVAGYSREQQRDFLRFCTGAPKLQVGTFQLKIQRAGPDSEQLPTASTCFNILLVPEYSSKAKLESKLLVAMQNAEGFGLQ